MKGGSSNCMLLLSSLQVRKRPLNKKEMTKKEEDIITIERMSNSLTVHEKKYKVSATCYMNSKYEKATKVFSP